jgi:hypothetical protein
VANLQAYADRMRNWCVNTDPICAAQQPTSHNASDHLSYFNVDSQAAASWIKSVASLTNTDSSFTTAVPISRSGTTEDYATVGTATPSGSVTLDTTWTSLASFAACTATSYSQRAKAVATTSAIISSSTLATANVDSQPTSMETSISPTTESSLTAKVTDSTDAGPSAGSSASSSNSSSSRTTTLSAKAGSLLFMLAAGAFFGTVLL